MLGFYRGFQPSNDGYDFAAAATLARPLSEALGFGTQLVFCPDEPEANAFGYGPVT